jgi:hypothetical protein
MEWCYIQMICTSIIHPINQFLSYDVLLPFCPAPFTILFPIHWLNLLTELTPYVLFLVCQSLQECSHRSIRTHITHKVPVTELSLNRPPNAASGWYLVEQPLILVLRLHLLINNNSTN